MSIDTRTVVLRATLAGIPLLLLGGSASAAVVSTGAAATNVTGVSPANEDASRAVDGTTSKYLNFGTDGNTAAPYTPAATLQIVPTLGAGTGGTIVNGVTFYTANDDPNRDPATFTLSGSTNGTDFTTIFSGAVSLPDAGANIPGTIGGTSPADRGRNGAGLPISTPGLWSASASFANTTAYTSYRLSIDSVRSDASANSTQFGEVELTGTVVPEPASAGVLAAAALLATARRRHRRSC